MKLTQKAMAILEDGDFSTKNSFEEARTVIGRAFSGTETNAPDPYAKFLMDYIPHSSKEEEVEFTKFVMGYPLQENLTLGAKIFGKRVDGKLVSVVCFREYDPKKTPGSWYKFLRGWSNFVALIKLAPKGVPKLFTDPAMKEHEKHFNALLKYSDAIVANSHKECVPEERHWYVVLVGVDPDFQDRGIGKETLAKFHAAADEQGVACYLEAAGHKNPAFYEKCGYKSIKNEELVDPVDPSRKRSGAFMLRKASLK